MRPIETSKQASDSSLVVENLIFNVITCNVAAAIAVAFIIGAGARRVQISLGTARIDRCENAETVEAAADAESASGAAKRAQRSGEAGMPRHIQSGLCRKIY